MIKFIKFLLGSPLTTIVDKIAETKIALAKEENAERKIQLERDLAVLEAKKATILQAQKDPFERWIRIGFAFPFLIYINKLVVWDKVLGLGKTDPLSAELSSIMMLILGAYFVHTLANKFK